MSNKKVLTKLNRRLLEENLKKVILETMENRGESSAEMATRDPFERWKSAKDVFGKNYNSLTSKEYGLLSRFIHGPSKVSKEQLDEIDQILNNLQAKLQQMRQEQPYDSDENMS